MHVISGINRGFASLLTHLPSNAGGAQGYNPDDAGEWIMVRVSNISSAPADRFETTAYYTRSNNADAFDVHELRRCHFAELVSLHFGEIVNFHLFTL